jgi:HEAT repeat protein
VTDVRELLLESKDMNKRQEIAKKLNSNPESVEELIKEIFQTTEPKFNDERELALNIIDFLNERLAIVLAKSAIDYAEQRIRVKGLQSIYRRQIDTLNDQIEKLASDLNEEFIVRKLAIHILGVTDSESFGRLLRNMMRNPDESIGLRKEAIFALTTTPSNASIGTLCNFMGNENVEIRRSSAWALAKIGSEDSICCLLAGIEDNDNQVFEWSVRGLRDMDSTRALQELANVMMRSPPEEQERLIPLVVEKKSEITLRAIAELLESDNVSVKRQAAWAMAVSPYPPALGMLEKLVNDDDAQIREYVKKALTKLGKVDPTDFGLIL